MKEQQPTHLVLVPLFVETMYKKIWSQAEKAERQKRCAFDETQQYPAQFGIDPPQVFKSVLDFFGKTGNDNQRKQPKPGYHRFFDSIGITILNHMA